MTYEIRTADLWPVDMEMRAVKDETDGLVIEGYALKFNVPSLPLQFPGFNRGRAFVEILEPTSVTRSFNASPDLTLRYQHDMTTLPLARTKSKTMTLTLTEVGLHQRSVLPNNEWGRPVYDAVDRRDVDGMSFRFDRPVDNIRTDGTYPLENVEGYGEIPVRRIRELRLHKEISITDSPAYPDTTVYARMLAADIDADPDELAGAFRVLRDQEAKLTPIQRDLIVAAVNAHADRPVLPTEVVAKNNSRREALNKLAG
jgi:HK97 family phage prohead protease